ncbi:hypothetical protein RRF57_011034 [Xylaria bambusicola]|uniref:Uncharacterized protein n=1 Tax=Xylaria bambusicola TaxID=326684 RepID=A0AAN7UT96_9PEZI
MEIQTFLLPCLAMLGIATALPDSYKLNPSICARPTGVYDVCDTKHSFIRCNGHNALLVTDCIASNSTYCRIVNGRGSCDGSSPPDLGGETPPCGTDSSTIPSATSGPI